MAATLTLSILEIVLLLFGAIILGITIHFFIASRRNLRAATEEMEKTSFARDEWKLRYFNDMENRDRELAKLKEDLQEAEENSRIYNMELDELRKEHRLLKVELENAREAGGDDAAKDIRIEELELQVHQLQGKLNQSNKAEAQQADQQQLVEDLRREMKQIRQELEKERAANQQAQPLAG